MDHALGIPANVTSATEYFYNVPQLTAAEAMRFTIPAPYYYMRVAFLDALSTAAKATICLRKSPTCRVDGQGLQNAHASPETLLLLFNRPRNTFAIRCC